MKRYPKITLKKVFFISLIFIFFLISSSTYNLSQVEAATNTVTFTTAGTSSWTAPANVTSVDVEVWGGGGGGGSRTSGTNACGGGGGGGAYAKSTVSVTPGNSYSYTVGAAGGAGVNGGNSSFNTSSVIAEGGKGVPSNTKTGGSGGLASNSTGTTKYNGGSGYTCTSGGGGGGGSGGTGSDGNTPTSSSGASAVTGGGPGGDGGTITSAYGQAPSSGPGGGGGGGYRVFANRTGGSGYAGKVAITYTLYTTIGDGTDPSNSSIAPGAAATEIDRFSFSDNYGTDTVTGLTVTLGPTGAYENISSVSVQTTAGVSKCTTSSITSDTVTLSSCAIAVTTTSTEYKILVTPKSHINMPSTPGSQPAITATVTNWTGTNTHVGEDANSATVTIDNLSPDNVTSATVSAGNQQVSLSWTNPTDSDFSTNGKVIILHRASSEVNDTPVEGTSYSVGNTVGNSTIACVTSGSPPSASCIDSGLTAGTPYYYKIFTQDSSGNFSQYGTTPTNSPVTPTGTTTLSTSSDSSNTIAPGSGVALAGQFTFTTSSGSDSITSLSLNLAGSPTGAYSAIDSISIRAGTCAGSLYYSTVTPSADNVVFSGGTPLSVTTSGNTYLICITPKNHSLSNGTYSLSPYVSSSWTSGSGNTKAGSDTNTGSLTIDNAPPNGATSVSGIPKNNKITLNWTTSNSADFNTTSGSVVYRWTGNSAGIEVPIEGSSPSVGDVNNTATVACISSSNGSTSQSITDGSGGSAECTSVALTNGQNYTYKVFQKDNYGNYDSGTTIGTFAPTSVCSSITTGNWSSGSTWTGACSGGSGQPANSDTVQITGGHVVTLNGTQTAANIDIKSTGTLTFTNSSSLTLYGVSGTIFSNNGVINAVSGSSVVIASPTTPTAIFSGNFTGSNAFYDLSFSPTIVGDINYSLGTAISVNHNLTIDPSSSGSNTLTTILGGTTTVSGTIDIKGETSAMSVLNTGNDYAITSGKINIQAPGTLTANNSLITLTGTTGPLFTRTGTFNSGGSTLIFDESTSNLVLNSGTLTLNSLQINLPNKTGTLGNTLSIGGNLSVVAGTFADGGYQITGNNTGTLSLASGSKLLLGSSSSTTFPTLFSNFSLASGNIIEYSSDQAQNVSNTPLYSDLVISNSGTKSLQGTTTINGNLTINSGSTLSTTSNNYNISLKGNWSNQGNFTANSSTVTLNGTDNSTQTISGNNSFYNLASSTSSNSTGKTIKFTGSSTTTVNGKWTIEGALGKLITINSTNSNAWNVSPASSLIDYAYISLSKNLVGSICATHSTDGGNNEGYEITSESVCDNIPITPAGTPMAYYKFDEGFGTTSNNSGFLQTLTPATISNTAWSKDGKFGGALNFDGSTNYVSVTNNNAFNLTENFTISAWIKPSSFGGNNLGRIFDRANGSNGYSFMVNGANQSLRLSSGSTNLDSNQNSITPNVWQHVSVVRSGTTITFFVNGKASGTGTLSTISSASNTTGFIGNNSSGTAGFNGLIDEIKIYSSALNNTQIKLENNHGSFVDAGSGSAASIYCVPGESTTCTPPVAELKFEKGSGTTVEDSSNKNNHGSFASGNYSPKWTTGKFGKALNFVASDHSNFTINSSSTTQIGSTGTISVWINPSSYPTSGTAVIVNKGNFSSKNNDFALYYENSTSSLVLTVGGLTTSASVKIPQTSTPLNVWSHVTAVWDGNYLNLYVNGFHKNRVAMNGYPTIFTSSISVGGDVTNNNFSGKLDNLAIFDYARTSSQVSWDYNQGLPIGIWKMNECQGTTIHDSSEYKNHGLLTIGSAGTQNAVGTCTTPSSTWGNSKNGKLNSSINLDGTDDYVTTNDNWSLRFGTQDFSITAWVNLPSTGGIDRGLVTKGNTNTGGYSFYVDGTTGKLGFVNQNSLVATSNSAVTDNNWHHIIVMRKGSDISFYIDGKINGTNTNYFSGIDLNSTDSLYIGRKAGNQFLNGQIDDLRIYNYSLSTEQIGQALNNGSVTYGTSSTSP